MELRKRKSNLKIEPDLSKLKKLITPHDVTTLTSVDKSDWKIENFLLDSEWKKLLDDEFQKDYFVQMNKFLEKGFQSKKFLPAETLVFNAFNSTKFDQVLFK